MIYVPIHNNLGFDAQYNTFYTMDLNSKRVLSVVVLNKNQVGGSSPRMEPESCRLSLDFLQKSGIRIK